MDAVVADGWERAAVTRGEVQHAGEGVAEVDAEAAADTDETKEQSVHIRKFDHPNHSTDSIIAIWNK